MLGKLFRPKRANRVSDLIYRQRSICQRLPEPRLINRSRADEAPDQTSFRMVPGSGVSRMRHPSQVSRQGENYDD